MMTRPMAEYVYRCRSSDALPWVGWDSAGPRNEHSKARLLAPHPLRGYPAYVSRYVAGSAPGASNAARRS